jgi:hypothetical protein
MGARRSSVNRLKDEPHVAKIKSKLADEGHRTLSEAAAFVDWELSELSRIIRDGISSASRASTIERLKKLKILDLVPKRESA